MTRRRHLGALAQSEADVVLHELEAVLRKYGIATGARDRLGQVEYSLCRAWEDEYLTARHAIAKRRRKSG